MYIARFATTWQDYPSPDDSAVVVFFAGCSHDCKDCHNKILQSVCVGELYDVEGLYNELVERCRKERTNKVVLEGGDPLYTSNLEGVRKLLEINKSLDICIYTGYTVQVVKAMGIQGFKYLKCGKYLASERCFGGKNEFSLTLASYNQRIYDSEFQQISNDNVFVFKKGEK